MTKKIIKSTFKPTVTAAESKIVPEVKPILELDEVDSPKKEKTTATIGVVEDLTKEATTPEFTELNRYIVIAKGGLVLREAPPSDTTSTNGMYAGAGIACIAYEDTFVEIKRVNNWSYGNYNGKSGWVCNVYLTKE